MKFYILVLILACARPEAAQKFDVKVVDRQDNQTDYTYVVPGHFTSQASSNVNCTGGLNSVNCNGSTTTTGSSTPAHQVSYHVSGATFPFSCPTGAWLSSIAPVSFRSAWPVLRGITGAAELLPLVDDIKAEFNGDKAKLVWVVSLDGKKTQSETYKVLAVLDKN